VKDKGISVSTGEGKKVFVIIDQKTRLPFGKDFNEGQMIRAVGNWESENVFIAEAIGSMGKKINPGGVKGIPHRRR